MRTVRSDRAMPKSRLVLYAIVALTIVALVTVSMQTPESTTTPNIHISIPNDAYKSVNNGVNFLGKVFCHPGYEGDDCKTSMAVPNPWVTDCPNLKPIPKFDKDDEDIPENPSDCSDAICPFLCYSHPVSGVMQVPTKLWKRALNSESGVWARSGSSNDRDSEHAQGFHSFEAIPRNYDIGHMIEVGSGPFTQSKNLLSRRTDLDPQTLTLLEPNMLNYLDINTCSYKDGNLNGRPVFMYPQGSEFLRDSPERYNTLIVINVIEHVQDGYEHLANIYNSLVPGGLLIFHERWYADPTLKYTGVLGDNLLHPIRISKTVLDHFLSMFSPLLSNEEQTSDQVRRAAGETGYYFIGIKR